MKDSLILYFLLFYSLSYGQLAVRNNAFVYVNDLFIYVEEDINLQEVTSSIYLRNEAQLLQGNENTFNRGIGNLSVYQEGNVNQWSYNYWCPPVGTNLLNTATNNAFRINQIDDPLDGTLSTLDSNNSVFTTDYNGTASPLVISNRWLWSLVNSSQYNGWIYLGENGDLAPGLGFTMKGNGTGLTGNTRYDFRGKPNTGTITNSVAEGEFTLIGNPYPSAIDAAAFIHDPDNINAIEPTIYYWEQDGNVASHVLQDYVGGYHEFNINPDGTVPTLTPAVFFTYDEQDNMLPLPPPGGFGNKLGRRFIPIGQGFMVEGIIGTSGIVSAKNSHRVFEKEGANSIFFRNSSITAPRINSNTSIEYQENGLSIVPDDYKRFRINIDFSVNENQYTRQIVLNFHESATPGHDRGLELKRSQNYASDAYFSLNNIPYSGQAYAFNEDLRIPLTVDIEIQQPLRFRIFDIQNFSESQGIYIYDSLTASYTNLRILNYELDIEPGHYNNRFEIVFTPSNILDLGEFNMQAITIHQNNSGHRLEIFNPQLLNMQSIELYDVIGKKVFCKSLDTIKTEYNLSTFNLSDGIYIVKLRDDLNQFKSQKIIVRN